MPKKPIAITVSTNFADVLPRVLQANQGLFAHWYVVTGHQDLETQEILQEYQDSVTTLLFDFQSLVDTSRPRPWRPRFNKGGALQLAQRRAYQEWPNDWYLILDTDIIVRNTHDLTLEQLDPQCLYGPKSRFDYRSWHDYQEHLPWHCRPIWQESMNVIGCFQLYRHHFVYEDSVDTRNDGEFSLRWPLSRRRCLDITVDHLGYHEPGVVENVNGNRVQGNGWLG